MTSLGLENVHVLITGAASGIGKATVHYSLQSQAIVSASDRSLQLLQLGLANHITNPRLHLVPADMRSELAVQQLFENATNHPFLKTYLGLKLLPQFLWPMLEFAMKEHQCYLQT